MTDSQNNKKIAKNTVLLYLRMLLIMIVSLYTSRIVLETLGFVDYGIYNIVGGIVVMFSFLNNAMSLSTQRFLSYEIGKKDLNQLSKVFKMSLNIHFIIALIIFVFAQTLGFWFLNRHLNIPVNRIEEANWVLQFSILTFLVSIITVPFNASIISHEKMGFYAYISILEVFLKLVIVFLLTTFNYDKLKFYVILTFIVSSLIRISYVIYCRKNFKETKYTFIWDKILFKKLINFNGWSLIGNLSSILYDQGINILLNIFFGPVVNAARGITMQVNIAVYSFVSNFQMAMNPQIIKSFASGNLEFMHNLIYKGAKYSFFLLLILTLPILFQTNIVLEFWLKEVPNYSVIFVKLILINSLIHSLSGTLVAGVLASEKIKKYNLIVGGLQLLNIPISYLFLKIGYSPEITLIVCISISLISFILRLYITAPLVNLSISLFFKDVVYKVLQVSFGAVLLPFLLLTLKLNFFVFTSFLIISTLLSIYFFGLKKEEKHFLKVKSENVLHSIVKF